MRLTASLALLAALLFGAQPAAAQATLQGDWTATKAERDGKPANDVVGNRLSFSGTRFEIRSKDDKTLFSGTFRTNSKVKPAAIDFIHAEGSLKGDAWKGIFSLSGDTLTIIDNAPDLTKARPMAFAAKNGSGYVLVTFTRAKP
jgi:uncharacterized protein (TIGR03067 family)